MIRPEGLGAFPLKNVFMFIKYKFFKECSWGPKTQTKNRNDPPCRSKVIVRKPWRRKKKKKRKKVLTKPSIIRSAISACVLVVRKYIVWTWGVGHFICL